MGDPVEEFAFDFLGRVLGVVVEPYDVGGRQRAVDALLHYPSGRVAALEVSSLGPEPEARISNVLASGKQKRRPVGLRNTWMAQVPRDFHPADLVKIDRAVLKCEEYGSKDLRALSDLDLEADALLDAGVKAFVTRRPASAQPTIWVLAEGVWGFAGTGIADLPAELARALSTDKMQSKVDKLIASGHGERHLFLLVRLQAFSFPVLDALSATTVLPATAPDLPHGLDQIWLAPEYPAHGILRGTKRGWSRVPVVQER